MDPIIKRFNRLIKSIIVDTGNIDFDNDSFSDNSNSDYAEAWDELNDFLSTPETVSKSRSFKSNSSSIPLTPEILRPDYLNLEVPFGSEFKTVKVAYKKLIIKYHPDKNNRKPEYMVRATEKTKDLNISFQKIKAWETAKQV